MLSRTPTFLSAVLIRATFDMLTFSLPRNEENLIAGRQARPVAVPFIKSRLFKVLISLPSMILLHRQILLATQSEKSASDKAPEVLALSNPLEKIIKVGTP